MIRVQFATSDHFQSSIRPISKVPGAQSKKGTIQSHTPTSSFISAPQAKAFQALPAHIRSPPPPQVETVRAPPPHNLKLLKNHKKRTQLIQSPDSPPVPILVLLMSESPQTPIRYRPKSGALSAHKQILQSPAHYKRKTSIIPEAPHARAFRSQCFPYRRTDSETSQRPHMSSARLLANFLSPTRSISQRLRTNAHPLSKKPRATTPSERPFFILPSGRRPMSSAVKKPLFRVLFHPRKLCLPWPFNGPEARLATNYKLTCSHFRSV